MIILSGLAAAPGTAWPLVSALPPLGALTTAPASARAHVGAVLPGWHLADLTDACQAVVSELVTNALEASTGPTGELIYVDGRMPVIRLRLLSDGSHVLIEVLDQAPGFPAPRRAASDAEDGRGLQLVDALTRGRWGWQAVDIHAKVVWAELTGGDARERAALRVRGGPAAGVVTITAATRGESRQ
jgi:anti-sigma regulatory factor (Ser/Thr protein kinase)